MHLQPLDPAHATAPVVTPLDDLTREAPQSARRVTCISDGVAQVWRCVEGDFSSASRSFGSPRQTPETK